MHTLNAQKFARRHLNAGRALARRTRLARVRRRALGRVGEGLAPLWPLLVYLPLVAGGALPRPEVIPPVAYAALGYWTWSLLTDAMQAPARGLAAHRQPGTAPAAAILAGVLEAATVAGWRAVALGPVALMAVVAVGGAFDPAGTVLALAVLLPGLALALGAGLILALWSAPWPDVTAGVASALRLTLLPSLVLFPLPNGAWATVATALNPLALWTESARSLALTGTLAHPVPLLTWSLFGVALLVAGLRGLARLAPRLRDLLA